tara:strand:- start:460 stop:681 length:222 start_codon:yes stop_codon:yes gene_type:complete
METPNKMIGGIAGAMAQQTGAIDQTTGMPTQLNQMAQNPYPNQNALGGLQAQLPNIVGQTALGQYDKIMPNKL